MYQGVLIYAPEKSVIENLAKRIAGAMDGRKVSLVLKKAAGTSIPDIASADLILFGSLPEGRSAVHADFSEMIRALKGVNLSGRVAGLFAMDSKVLKTLEKAFQDTEITLKKESILLVENPDNIYMDQMDQMDQIKTWINTLLNQLGEESFGG